MKKKEKSSDELLAEVYVSTYKYLHDSTLNTISFYENQYKMYENLIDTHKDMEPIKLFKKSHQKWQDELDRLIQCYDDAWTNFINECKELEEVDQLAVMS